MKTDKQLQQDVIAELEWDARIDASKIGVSAKNGVVTLNGEVSKFSDKYNAEEAAMHILGVQAVANDLKVTLPGDFVRSDSSIAAAALSALEWDTLVPNDKIRVVVRNGALELEGQVDFPYQRNAAYSAVRNLAGVTFVTNSVTVKPLALESDVKHKIKAALHRHAEIDANKIDVDVVDRTVILSGAVTSYAEKCEAERAAWNAPGVSKVTNNLAIYV